MDFAKAGWVVLVVEYHGTDDGPYGDLTYPGPDSGSAADGIVQLDLKGAVSFFAGNNPRRYGASISKDLIAIGASSGGHNACMLALTDSRFTGAIGWSGMPDAADAGNSEGQLDHYSDDSGQRHRAFRRSLAPLEHHISAGVRGERDR